MVTKKEFYFIRHGQTDYNVSPTLAEDKDISLNATGIKQAQAIEHIIAQLPVKLICCSPLKRAKETKDIISTRLKAHHHEICNLGECSQQIWDDMILYGPHAYTSSHMHVKAFMQQALQGINQALVFEGTPLVVAHGGIHWAICCLMGVTNHEWQIDNCVPIHFFTRKDGQWQARKLT